MKFFNKSKYQKLINELNLKNVRFTDWVPYEQISKEIAKADLCLGGHFSTIPKATRVIAGKTFQFINTNRKIIIANNQANKELFLS